MSVSVALCTHNGSRFLAAQLESIYAQTVLPDELIISDDASTDATLAMIDEIVAAHAPSAMRVTVLANSIALGVTANFERAIAACTSDVILLSEQYDVWSPERVQRTLQEFDDPTVMLVHSDATLIDAEGATLPGTLFEAYSVDAAARHELAHGDAFAIFMRRNLVTGATAAIRANLARAAMPFAEGWVHDEWLAIVAASIGRIAPIEQPLIGYRQHGNNEIGAVKLTLSAKLRRLTAPGWARNRRLLERAEALATRYPQLGEWATPTRIDAVARKLAHEQARSALSVHRLARIAPVVREARTGRYSEFGGGLQDIVRDLVQPLTPGLTARAR